MYYYGARWYDPYNEITAGQNMSGRFYDPALGRWIQPDTIVPDPSSPQSLNRYSYVRNCPVRYNDPSGHCIPGVDCPNVRDEIGSQTSRLPSPKYSGKELALVALTLLGEGDPYRDPAKREEAYTAIAWNIRNRVESDQYPNSYKEVVTQKKQYQGLDRALEEDFHPLDDDGRAIDIARAVMSGHVPIDPAKGALYFIGADQFDRDEAIFDYYKEQGIIVYSVEGESDWRPGEEGLYFSHLYVEKWPPYQ